MSTENIQETTAKKARKPSEKKTSAKSETSKAVKTTESKGRVKETKNAVQKEKIQDEPIECRTLAENELYKEIYKNVQMAIDSIEALKPYIDEKALKTLFSNQLKKYQNLSAEIEFVCHKSQCELSKSTVLDKAYLKGMMYIASLKNPSVSKIVERSIQGVNMGVINITRALNNVSDGIDTTYADKLLSLYNSSIDHLRFYL